MGNLSHSNENQSDSDKRMPNVIYINMLWLLIMTGLSITSSIKRHLSAEWNRMPDLRLGYDFLFVGVFGLLFLMTTIGLLKRKKWGYDCAMCFNYILALMALVPVIALVLFNWEHGIPLSEILKIDWSFHLGNILISAVSVVFISLMRRSNIKSIFQTIRQPSTNS